MSYAGGYATAYGHGGDLQGWWWHDGLHLDTDDWLHGAIELPDGTITVPSLRMPCDTGFMGWRRAVDFADDDYAWTFSHGLQGDVLAVEKGGLRIFSGKEIFGYASDAALAALSNALDIVAFDGENDRVWTNDYAQGLNLATMTNPPATWTNQDTLATVMARGNTSSEPIVTGSQSTTNILTGNLEGGTHTLASGDSSTAFGANTIASGNKSVALGLTTEASGDNATSMGYGTEASGDNATSMGYGTEASGDNATALGRDTTASGINATSMGYGTDATGDSSTALGANTTASGARSTAFGESNTASGNNATALGKYTMASGSGATALGYGAFASNDNSFVFGDGQEFEVISTADDQVTFRCQGGKA